ncbi:MAG: FtsX-like permease family protein [Bacteroidales bacterium]|nr:FtsX-like permease family protein [Bacteroidales bacterium]
MVFVQFAVSTILLIGIFTVTKQLKFIQNKDLGYQKENIVYLPFNGMADQYHTFKRELLNLPNINGVTAKNSLTIEIADKTTDLYWPGKEENQEVFIEATGVDYDYFSTMGLNMVEGRCFSVDFLTDKGGLVVNQDALIKMGLTNAIGQKVNLWGFDLEVIGVVNNANFYSLKETIGPQAYYLIENCDETELDEYGVILIKIAGNYTNQTFASIEKIWTKLNPEVPFELNFLDSAVNHLYVSEKRLAKLVQYFTILSILISCLGLLGITNLAVRECTKEIGIRKVNGAKRSEILIMINTNYAKWVITAFFIACPMAWIILKKWLEEFAYRTQLNWWIFFASGLSLLLISSITVSLQSWRAASRNPVESLRYE